MQENETTEIETTETEIEPTETKTEPTETETEPAEPAAASDAAAKPAAEDNSANRGYFLKVVAGFYLIYTAYELASSYIKNEEGSSLGFCVAGIIFGLIGVFLLYIVVRDYIDNHRQM